METFISLLCGPERLLISGYTNASKQNKRETHAYVTAYIRRLEYDATVWNRSLSVEISTPQNRGIIKRLEEYKLPCHTHLTAVQIETAVRCCNTEILENTCCV